MDYRIKHGIRTGNIKVPASKSYAHRMLISAALGNKNCIIECDGISKDIKATADCLTALGAKICIEASKISINPVDRAGKISEETIMLPCNESGSTLRFLTPVVGALGVKAAFVMQGKLAERPMAELTDELERHGMSFDRKDNILYCFGRLNSGEYSIPGNISSQYITGLLFALPLLEGDSILRVTGNMESADYVVMTEKVLEAAGVRVRMQDGVYHIKGSTIYNPPVESVVEGDWSNAAFYACMGAMSDNGVVLQHMRLDSCQGDRAIIEILKEFGADVQTSDNDIKISKGDLKGITVDAKPIPDLVPAISALAAYAEGTTRITNAGRLRMKESDRLKTTTDMLRSLGADITEYEDELVIVGMDGLDGGTADGANDHRIAMAAAVAACGCRADVTVLGAECVAKSYPDFWKDLESLTLVSNT